MSTVSELIPVKSNSLITYEAMRDFVELEADLLDQRDYANWLKLYADDGVYWVPAEHGQTDFTSHVSIFYDDKHILKTRVARLLHPMIHVQDPPSNCVRILSNIKFEADQHSDGLVRARAKFIMLEDRPDHPRRYFGGTIQYVLRSDKSGLQIVLKRVNLTNCDASFAALSQPI